MAESYQQFMTGLNATNVLSKLQTTGHLEEAFGIRDKKLTAEMLEDIFKVIKYSKEGTNQRREEEVVIGRFHDILQDFEEDEDNLQKLLIFATAYAENHGDRLANPAIHSIPAQNGYSAREACKRMASCQHQFIGAEFACSHRV